MCCSLLRLLALAVLVSISYQEYTHQQVFRFANHYESHMVLQRAPHRAVIWGYGESGQNVSIHVDGKEISPAITFLKEHDNSSIWKMQLDPMPAGGPYKITATSTVGGVVTTAVLEDVLFGDVWVCSGQSNMEFTVSKTYKGQEEMEMAGNYTKIRLLTVKNYFSEVPVSEVNQSKILQQWTVASKESTGGPDDEYFSAVCWMYGRRLYDLYKIPIGLISSDFGGTYIETWSSEDVLKTCYPNEDAKNVLDSCYRQQIPSANTPMYLWNAMIRPFINTTILGVIWYQGEGNTFCRQYTYDYMFSAMINDWREKWYEGTNGNTDKKFPFGFVQIGAFEDNQYFPMIRWKQTAEYGYVPNNRIKNAFMAVAMDLPDDSSPFGSIHPRDKTTVAERLVLGARAIAYNETIVYHQGPIVDFCIKTNMNNTAVVNVVFKNLDDGKISVKSERGFEVLTVEVNPRWIPVNIAMSEDYGVTFKVQNGTTPQAVRYAWESRPCDYKNCAIYSVVNNLPAPPFVCYLTSQTVCERPGILSVISLQ